jgi:very-short-patch-repair endonuclease
MHMVDRSIMRIAERRSGLITRTELLQLGLSPAMITWRLGNGTLRRVHRNVYSTTDVVTSLEHRALAACLAVPTGAISHTTAGASHGIRGTLRHWLEMSVPPGRHPTVDGVHFRRTNQLPEHHTITWVTGLRVTTVARTLFDLGAVLDPAAHRSAIDDCLNRKLVTLTELAAVGGELVGRGRPGSASYRSHVAARPPAVRPVMSAGELALVEGLEAAGLTTARQHPVRLPSGRDIRIDIALPDARVAIEVDHPVWHATPDALQRDHTRDNELAVLGWEHLRFTTDDVEVRLASCVATVCAVQRRRAA